MTLKAQIIDVFAGPGGLGEGFSAFQDDDGNHPFQIKISVEMEQYAHKTLRLRAFTRFFLQDHLALPQIYLDYISGKNKLLGKLIEFRVFSINVPVIIKTENDTRNWSDLSPESYCPETYSKAIELYGSDWETIIKAIKHCLYESRRMTLGPDEKDIHKAIDAQLISNVPTILIGGPPCQAFSTVGRSRRKGHVINNVVTNDDTPAVWNQDDDGRTWLYKEYIKIIGDFKPDVFVMENVRGMLSAKITDDEGNKEFVWKRIFKDLNKPEEVLGNEYSNLEYDLFSFSTSSKFTGNLNELNELKSSDFVLLTKEYGIPQARERVILLGIKKGISSSLGRSFVSALTKIQKAEQTQVRDAIGDLPALRAGVGKQEHFSSNGDIPTRTAIKKIDEAEFWDGVLDDKLKETLAKLKLSSNTHLKKVRSILNCANLEHYLLLDKPQKFMTVTDDHYESTNDSIQKFAKFEFTRLNMEADRSTNSQSVTELSSWYSSNNTQKIVVNHETRNHMDTDLCRYVYSSSYTLIKPNKGEKTFPRLPELESAGLDPKGHKNKVSFIDRFRTQVWDLPATTVTSHISKDGHYYIHPATSQMRSLTVREAARIQPFPDNYFFEGPRTAQFVQVGNAVPPLLAKKIANVVIKLFTRIIIEE